MSYVFHDVNPTNFAGWVTVIPPNLYSVYEHNSLGSPGKVFDRVNQVVISSAFNAAKRSMLFVRYPI